MSFVYEWDEAKYASILKKHGIRFEEALIIFSDSNALEMLDVDSSFEARVIRIGLYSNIGVLVVLYFEREDNKIRIISARFATRTEEGEYEKRI